MVSNDLTDSNSQNGRYTQAWSLTSKFEVANFSVAEILKGNSQILRSSPNPGPQPLFSGWDFMMGLGKRSCMPNVKLLALAVAEILKGDTKFWGTPQPRATSTFLLVGLDHGP